MNVLYFVLFVHCKYKSFSDTNETIYNKKEDVLSNTLFRILYYNEQGVHISQRLFRLKDMIMQQLILLKISLTMLKFFLILIMFLYYILANS